MPNMPGPDDQDRQVGAAAVAVKHHPGRQQRVRRCGSARQAKATSSTHARGQEAPGRRGATRSAWRRWRTRRPGRTCRRRPAPRPGCRAWRRAPWLALEQPQRAAGDRGAGEDQVDVQAPAPRQVLGQRPAEQQPDRAARARDGAVDAERLAALLRVAERRGQQGQRRRRQHRGEHALAGAGGDQHREVDRGAADRRGDGEAGQAGEEHDLAADKVGQPAAEQQQAAERQRVRRHDPLPVHVAEAQRMLRRRAARGSSPSCRGRP